MSPINTNYIHHLSSKEYNEAVNYILRGTLPSVSPTALGRFKRRWADAQVRTIEGRHRLFIGEREVIPGEEIGKILARLYDDPATGGNAGRDRFYSRVCSLYIGISRSDVERFVSNDLVHQLLRRVSPKMKVVRPLPIPQGPNYRWEMDLIEMPEESVHINLGYLYVLCIVDIFSKYAFAVPLKSKSAEEVTQTLEKILQTGGTPKILSSDNGTEFKNFLMKDLSDTYGFKQVFGSPYRPQSQGAVERFNQTLKRMLYAHMMRYRTNVWVDVLPTLVENYNDTIHSTTNFSPSKLHAMHDEAVLLKVNDKIFKRNQKWRQKYARHYKSVSIGDPVRLSLNVFSDYRRQTFVGRSYKQNWTSEIYTIVSISEPKNPLQQPQYTVEDKDGNRLRVFRDNVQLLPSFTPRITSLESRPRYEGFFYRDIQMEAARRMRGQYQRPVTTPITITDMRKRRSASVWLRDYIVE